MQLRGRSLVWLLLILSLSAVLDVGVAMTASVTTDEQGHLGYGKRILQGHADRLVPAVCDSQMPVSALNAAPLEVASQLEARQVLHPLSEDATLELARIPTILAALALGLLVYLWTYDLYGEGPALASCLLCTISPNLIAHGTLVTTDMYHTVGVVGSLFLVHRFLRNPTLGATIAAAVALALAQVAKSFAIVLYVVSYLAIAFVMLRRTPTQSLTPRRVLLFTAIAAVAFFATLNAAFCFDRTFHPVSYYVSEARGHHINKAFLDRLQQRPLISHVPVPFPVPFIEGLAMMRMNEQSGRMMGNIYLLGEVRDTTDPSVRGFKSYYAVALFYKEPIALQILFVWGLVWIARNRKLEDFVVGEGLLLAAAAILLLWFSFSRAQIGIRHILPALAIETIIAGAAFYNFSAKSLAQKSVLCLLVLWMAISVASYYPQMIPYMNEWVHDRRLSYTILSDSNLDWGQDHAAVAEFLKKNPDVVLDPPRPVAGRVLVRANRLTGVYRWDSATYLAKRYKPVAQVGYAHFLFVVPAEDIASARP